MKSYRIFILIAVFSIFAGLSFAEEYSRKANEEAIQKELKKMDNGIAQGPYKMD